MGRCAISDSLWSRLRRRSAGGETASHNYNPVAWLYERTSRWYSFGRIGASKAWQVQYVKPGGRMLYCGVGGGEDAVLAARLGAHVTCIDISDKMLARAECKFEDEDLEGEFICNDVTKWKPPVKYDAVAANYFLNIFDDDTMADVLDHLISLIEPGGSLMVADFMPPQGGGIARIVQRVHQSMANLLYWAIGLSHRGPVRHYPDLLSTAGLNVTAIKQFPLTRWGPPAFWSVVASKPGGAAA